MTRGRGPTLGGRLFDLSGATAVVTGAGSGIGAALAVGLAQHGAAVVLCDVDGDALGGTAEVVRQGGGTATTVLADVRDPADVSALVTAAVGAHGGVDVLVNNVGGNVGAGEPTESLDVRDWRATVELTTTSTFLCCQAVRDPMSAAGGGAIVNIASLYGLIGHDYRLYDPRDDGRPHEEAAYAAAKGGVVALTRALALYWARHGIRVNAIAPGHVRTPATDGLSAATWDRLQRAIPLGRAAVPEDLVGAAVFLAARASAFVTGHVLAVDGGWLVR